MNKKITLALYFSLIAIFVKAQIIITNPAVPYTQDFNTLASTGTVSTTPTGWFFLETGSNANTTYSADNGAAAGGNTYSYGATSASDRAFGGLQSGSLTPTFGANFTNSSVSTITSLNITYIGEQWRLGTISRLDKLDFQYSTDATVLNDGTWVDVDGLDFSAPITSGTVGLLDGNAVANKTSINFIITGLNIAPGTNFWIRWNDFNASGADDGLAIDDLNIVFNAASLPACLEPTAQPTALNLTATPTTVSGNFTASAPISDEYLVIRSTTNSLSASPIDGTVYTAGQSFGGGNVVIVTSGTSFTDINLSPTTIYYYYIFSLNDQDCIGGPNYLPTAALTGNINTPVIPPCIAPSSAATNLVLTAANNFIGGSFTAAAGANRYLAVISTSSTLSSSPVNGTTYTAGQSFGGGTIVTYSSATTFTATGLLVSTQYYLFVFSANADCTGQPYYNTTALQAIATTTNASTGIPVGFYDAANGQTCQTLKTTLKTISSTGYNTLSYTPGLWNAYQYTDIKPATANFIWDIYTDDNNPAVPETYNFSYSTDQCGTYSKEGDCYNREHTTPQSWFNQASPMVSDIQHILPTDGKVNGVRSNYPYGEVTNVTYTSIDNQSKLGTGTNFGYTGIVFEPIDAFKGDVARISLYMVTRYEDQVIGNNWSANGTANAALLTSGEELFDAARRRLQIYDSWYLKTIFKWINQDPVSQKEIDRNNAIYYQSGQHNRNPFVDHPEYAYLIWQCTGIIPVTITDFVASKQNESVLLKWYATFETSFKQYDIERSTDAVHFNKIASEAGRNLANYSYTDNKLPSGSIVYYRLKMIDIDGSFNYSKTIAVRLNNNFSNALVYPNPTMGALQIKLTEAIATNTTLIVTDVTGRLVKQQNIMKGAFSINLDAKSLTNGRYFIKINDGKSVINQSFVVIK